MSDTVREFLSGALVAHAHKHILVVHGAHITAWPFVLNILQLAVYTVLGPAHASHALQPLLKSFKVAKEY